MVYPKQVIWNHAVSGHQAKEGSRSQRSLVEASLLASRPTPMRWDEQTRTMYDARQPARA